MIREMEEITVFSYTENVKTVWSKKNWHTFGIWVSYPIRCTI